jgi:hypothetical protein
MSYDPNVPNPPRGDGGGSNTLYFLVGGLVVLAGVFVFLYTNDYIGPHDVNVNVQAPATEAAPAQPAPVPAPAPATGGTTNTQ